MARGDIGEMSVELMVAPLRDEENDRLDAMKKDLDLERQAFTEAAIKLGKERAELQVNILNSSALLMTYSCVRPRGLSS